MKCQNYEHLREKYLEGTLSPQQESDLKQHVRECAFCREDYENATALAERVREALAGKCAPSAARRMILAQLTAEKATPIGEKNQAMVYGGPAFRRIAAAVLAAAALVMVFIGWWHFGVRPAAPPHTESVMSAPAQGSQMVTIASLMRAFREGDVAAVEKKCDESARWSQSRTPDVSHQEQMIRLMETEPERTRL